MALKRTGRFGAIWLSFSLDCTMATTNSLTGPLQMDITQQLEQLRQIWTAPWNPRSPGGVQTATLNSEMYASYKNKSGLNPYISAPIAATSNLKGSLNTSGNFHSFGV